MMMKKKWICALSGALTGIVNGLFGAGGGLILVPLLIRAAKLEARRALPTSVLIILPMCAVSAARYLARENIGLQPLLPYLAGGLAGGILAGLTFDRFPVTWLRRILGVFILYAGVKMVFQL